MIAVAINSQVGADPGAGIDKTQDSILLEGSLTLTGNYGGAATHGDVMSFGSLDQVKSSYSPKRVRVFEAPPAGTAPQGIYEYTYCPGTTSENGQLYIWDTATDAELTEGAAYPAGLLTAVLRFEAYFTNNN